LIQSHKGFDGSHTPEINGANEINGPYRIVHTCRVCGSGSLTPYLDLGLMPLVNRYLSRAELDIEEPRFPLKVLLCGTCSLSQLSVVIDPRVLFSDYSYFSSVSQTFQHHCQIMAESLQKEFGLSPSDLVVEIASNDGCLLSKFKARGMRVRGVEPARNLARLTEGEGIPTLCEFWGKDAADKIAAMDGKAKVVVATNVLAHVDDVHGFIGAVKELLNPKGVFVFEVPYMVHFIDRTEFDTTYHEHLSYFLLRPLKRVLEANGMQIVDALEFSIHGGTLRVIAQIEGSGQLKPKSSVREILELEEGKGLYGTAPYFLCADRVQLIREELSVFVKGLKANGRRIAAYGASAKGNILLNYCALGPEFIDYVVDDTPAKQGKFYPGNHLPIVGRNVLHANKPEYLLLLAWNFAEELMRNTAEYGITGGRYVIPIPALHVVAVSPEKRRHPS